LRARKKLLKKPGRLPESLLSVKINLHGSL
jgi:hypothetical protein